MLEFSFLRKDRATLAQPGEGPFILKTHFTRHWEVFSTLGNQEQDIIVGRVGLPPLERQKLHKESKFIAMGAMMAVRGGTDGAGAAVFAESEFLWRSCPMIWVHRRHPAFK